MIKEDIKLRNKEQEAKRKLPKKIRQNDKKIKIKEIQKTNPGKDRSYRKRAWRNRRKQLRNQGHRFLA